MLLPVVERELRIAARRPATHWARFAGAGVAMLIVFVLLLSDLNSRAPRRSAAAIFTVLSVLTLVFCALAGVFLSASPLCAEKRDGTLGLLFLTDLKPMDIVLGKLAATSIVAVYAVLAVIPMMGLPLLMGGVTLGEFGRMTLLIGLTLWLSLSSGILASTVCWETRTSMFLTLAVQLALMAGPILVIFLSWALSWANVGHIWLPSPFSAFHYTYDTYYQSGAWRFWFPAGLMAGLAWVALALSSWLLPRQLGEKQSRREAARRERPRAERALLAQNPFAWLARRDRFPGWPSRLAMGLLLLIWSGFLIAPLFTRSGVREPMLLTAFFMAYGLHFVVKVLMAVQATRQLGEDRRVGALELILVTPLTTDLIVAGLRWAYLRQFRWMNWGLLGMNLALALLVGVGRPFDMPGDVAFIFCVVFVGGALLLFADTHALIWVGAWAGLQGSPPYRAALRTIGRVLVPPWVCAFLFFLAISGGGGLPKEAAMVCTLLWVGLGLTTSVVATGRPRWELKHLFRALASGDESALAQARNAPARVV